MGFTQHPDSEKKKKRVFWRLLYFVHRVHSSVPRHFEKMFTATLLALGTRLVKFHFSSLVKISVFASFALKIEQLSIKWAQGCLKLKIWVLIRLKHAWKPKLEIWNFTSLVPRARSVAVNIFSKCHGKDEWTLVECRCIISTLESLHLKWICYVSESCPCAWIAIFISNKSNE